MFLCFGKCAKGINCPHTNTPPQNNTQHTTNTRTRSVRTRLRPPARFVSLFVRIRVHIQSSLVECLPRATRTILPVGSVGSRGVCFPRGWTSYESEIHSALTDRQHGSGVQSALTATRSVSGIHPAHCHPIMLASNKAQPTVCWDISDKMALKLRSLTDHTFDQVTGWSTR